MQKLLCVRSSDNDFHARGERQLELADFSTKYTLV